jgi:glycosyltransferase involved in cell wall biosynthesis
MLSGQNIVCFSPDPSWHHLWRNRHQIMTRLARQNKILFVEPTPYLRPVLQAVRETGPRALFKSTFHQPMPNLWVYRSANAWPIAGKTPIRQLGFTLRRWQLRRILARLHMQNPILWVFRYDLGEMIGHLHEKLVIYHAVDDYAAYVLDDTPQAEQHRQRIRALERHLLTQADVAFVSSATLLSEKQRYNENTFYVPNAADYHTFAAPPRQLPADIAAIPGPRISYVGAINEKLDVALLTAVARVRPDWHVVLVGPVQFKRAHALDALQALPNVHLLGAKPVSQLPAYMHASHVCLMPYAHNDWARNISPLKLYEYLATGRPVVATDIPAVQHLGNVLAIADNETTFIQAIQRALTEDTPAARAQRQALASQNTWEHRVDTLSSIISGFLGCA